MGKLPYIPNKKLYAAVMGACSYIRKTGYFNKATTYYADKYDVDVEDVKKYVRIAQGNGQKMAVKRKYKWYVLIVMKDWYCAGDDGVFASWDWSLEKKFRETSIHIERATSEQNAEKHFGLSKDCPVWYRFEVPHEEYRVIHIKEFSEKQKAEDYAAEITDGFIKECLQK